jgi:protein-tyrosine phosphatase
MIDIHSHLLPGIDDGPRSVNRPVKVLNRFASEGVTDVILTPHARSSDFAMDAEDSLERRDVALTQLSEVAPESPRLHLGFEIMMDQPLPAAVLDDRRFALAGSRYYLVEFYTSVAFDSITKALEMLREAGVVPVIAHVERYDAATPENLSVWREIGAKAQVDAREYVKDNARGRNARLLTSHGLIDMTASDNHGDERSMSLARQYFEESGYPDIGLMLCEANPRAVLADDELEDVEPVKLKEGWWSRVKWAFGA